MRRRAGFVVLASALTLLGVSADVRAQQPGVWTKFQTNVPHATVANIACGLGAKAILDGASHAIVLRAFEDAQLICAGTEAPDAIHGRVRMTHDPSKPSNEVIVELEPPLNASPNAMNDLRNVLVNMSADLDRRTNGVAPVAQPTPPPVQPPPQPPPPPSPPVPMHRVTETNVPVIAAGAAVFGASYLVTLLVGTAIVGAAGDPGTGRYWPFVPFIGTVAFSVSYKEASNCDCDTGRVISVIGSVLIDAAQIAGLIISIVGVASPRTKLVPDTVSLRVGFGSLFLEGRF